MLQLVGILPWTRRMQRRPADMLAAMRASVSGSLQARSFFAAAGGPAEQRRSYAKRAPGSKDDGEKPPAAPPADTITETEDAVEAEDEYSFPASLEKALVKATVPDFVPELIGVPIDRRPVFPGFYKTFSVRDERVAAALTRALKKGQPYVGLFLSKDSAGRDSRSTPDGDLLGGPADAIRALEDVFAVGTFAQIVNLIPSKGDGITAIVYPHRRIRATGLLPEKQAGVSRVHVENCPAQPYNRHSQVIQALMQEIFVMLTEVAKLNPFFREHITHHNVPSSIFEEPAKLADFIAVLTSSPAAELQEILETEQVEERLRKALVLLKKELMTAELQSAIRKEVETKLNKKQREYMLHEQLRTIKKELGLETDTKEKLAGTFRERAAALAMPEDVRRVFDEELGKLAVLEPAGSEFSVTRNYLDWLTLLPWGRFSAESFDIGAAARVLDEDHYGLQDVKDRILEFIAVAKLRGSVAGKILCLVGPPGVGKTSIGRSIARALGRQYFRFSVGGLADVAEIKGHRRTYVGAMPGKLIQALKKVQTGNPLVLIDEIDKLGKGQQGDPASALLELLDPEQNAGFLDHYLDVPVDLSKVLFVCTANTTDSIPGPLLDRMEVISLSGYVAQEKMEIARRYLVPAARAGAGLTAAQAPLPDAVLDVLNREYCREAGVRNLKKHIEKLFRKAALRTVQEGASTLAITTDSLKAYVGSPVFASEKLYGAQLPPGVVTGLAWTSMGTARCDAGPLTACL